MSWGKPSGGLPRIGDIKAPTSSGGEELLVSGGNRSHLGGNGGGEMDRVVAT